MATDSLVAVLNGAGAYDFRLPLWGYVTKPWSLNASALSACSKLKVSLSPSFTCLHASVGPCRSGAFRVSLHTLSCSATLFAAPQEVFQQRAARFFSAPDTEDGVRSKLLDVVCNAAFDAPHAHAQGWSRGNVDTPATVPLLGYGFTVHCSPDATYLGAPGECKSWRSLEP